MRNGGKDVDPAALLVAVFTVGLGPLTEAGAWELINSVVSALVLTVVAIYTTGERWEAAKQSERWAAGLVMGFVLGIGLAYPAQTLWGLRDKSDSASYIGLGVGLALAALGVCIDWSVRSAIKRRQSAETPTAIDGR